MDPWWSIPLKAAAPRTPGCWNPDMLSRTADHLYWMSRYIERAESLARLVDAHYRMSLLPHSVDTLAQSLISTMTALHMDEAYNERHETIEPRTVFEFVSLDRDYSGSIFS